LVIKRIKIKSWNIFMFLMILFFLSGCNKNNLQKDTNNISNILPNILYTAVHERSYGVFDQVGQLIKYQISSEQKGEILLESNKTHRLPRIFPDNSKIIVLAYSNRKLPIFNLINIKENKRTKIDFSEELVLQDVMDGVSDIAIVNDTSFIFGFRDNLYLTSTLESSKKVIKNFNGRRIGEFSLSKSKNLLAFSYQMGFDKIKQEKLGLYNFKRDSIELLDIDIYRMGNFSPNSERLTFTDNYTSVSIMNLKTREILKLKDFPELKNIDLYYAFFIDDETLLILDSHKEYIYSLKSNSIIKTTSQGIFIDVSVNY